MDDEEPLLRKATGNNGASHGTFVAPGSAAANEPAKPAAIHGPIEVTGRKLILIFGFTWFSAFLAAIDHTMTSTTSAVISSAFGSLALIGWLGSAYLIAIAAVQPLSGKLTDIFGRRNGLMFASVMFIIGNLLCGLSNSAAMIVAGRVVAGIGGGGLNSITTFVTTDIIPPRKRAFWQGIGMIMYGTGIALGGVIGGGINDILGWRWAFFLLCPLTLIAAVGMYFTVPAELPYLQKSEDESLSARIRRIDFLGSILLVSALAAMLISLDVQTPRAQQEALLFRSNNASRIILATLLPASAILFLLFAYNESRVQNPIVPISLLTNRNVVCSYLAACCTSAILYALLYHVPLFFQARGASTSLTGALIVPEAIGIAVGSFSSGVLLRGLGNYTYIKPVVLVILLFGAGGFALSTWHIPTWAPILFLFANGFGFGGTMNVFLMAIISSIDHSMQAVATGGLYAFRSIGGSIGISVGSLIFRAVLESKGHGVGVGDGLAGIPKGGCQVATGVDDRAVCDGYAQALRAVFWMAFGFAIAALVAGLLIRNVDLKSKFNDRTDGVKPADDGA